MTNDSNSSLVSECYIAIEKYSGFNNYSEVWANKYYDIQGIEDDDKGRNEPSEAELIEALRTDPVYPVEVCIPEW